MTTKTSNRSNNQKRISKDAIVCSYCSNIVIKSAYQFSCEHIICIFCISRGVLLSSLSPLVNKTTESLSSDLSIIKLSCNKCIEGSADIKLNDFVNLVLIPTECLQHNQGESCPKCNLLESQIETTIKCSFGHNRPSNAYCKSCQLSICNECITSNFHSKHKVKELLQYQREVDDITSKMKLISYEDFSSWLYDKHKQFNTDYQSEYKATMDKIDLLIESLTLMKRDYQKKKEKHIKRANDVFDIIFFMYYLYYKQIQSRSNDISRLAFLKKMKQQIDSIDYISNKAYKELDSAQSYISQFNEKIPNTFQIKISYINALNKSSYTLFGHQGYVFNVIELNKEHIASCSEDKDIRIWNMKSKECSKTIVKAHSSSIYSLCKLKDNQFSSGSFAEIKLWNSETFIEEGMLTGHTDYVVKLRYLNDKDMLLSSSNDKTLRTWDIHNRKCLYTLTGHSGYANSFTPITNTSQGDLASVSFDKTLKIWELERSECLYTIQAHDGPIYSIIQLKDSTVITGSYSEFKQWNVNTKECLLCIIERNTGVYDLLELSNGKLASCSFQTINIWDLSKKEDHWITSLNEHSHFVTSLLLFKERVIVSASDDMSIKIWD